MAGSYSSSSISTVSYTHLDVYKRQDVYMVALRDADGTLIGYYEKHEYRSPETMKLYDME